MFALNIILDWNYFYKALIYMNLMALENPEELMDMLKNPEHPYVQKIMGKVQGIIKEKIRSGAISQNDIVREVEAIKAKITSIFGNMFNDALGGRQGDIPSSALLGNSPEARRQRMLARLQKKHQQKLRGSK